MGRDERRAAEIEVEHMKVEEGSMDSFKKSWLQQHKLAKEAGGGS